MLKNAGAGFYKKVSASETQFPWPEGLQNLLLFFQLWMMNWNRYLME